MLRPASSPSAGLRSTAVQTAYGKDQFKPLRSWLVDRKSVGYPEADVRKPVKNSILALLGTNHPCHWPGIAQSINIAMPTKNPTNSQTREMRTMTELKRSIHVEPFAAFSARKR